MYTLAKEKSASTTLLLKEILEYRVLGLGKGAELGASVAIELAGKLYSPIHDHRGNIVCLLDSETGLPLETYRYTAYGESETYSAEKRSLTTPGALRASATTQKQALSTSAGVIMHLQQAVGLLQIHLGFADGPNMYAYVRNNPLTKFDLYGLFIEDEDITGGRSAHALAAMAYGFGEAVVVGTHDFVCMLHAAERQAEIFENGTLEESNQAFINSYTATAAPIHQAAEALRASVMEKLQSGVRDVNLDHYHTAGSYAAYGVAVVQGGRAVWGIGKSVRTLAVDPLEKRLYLF